MSHDPNNICLPDPHNCFGLSNIGFEDLDQYYEIYGIGQREQGDYCPFCGQELTK